ncbi:MAG: 30S ribosomal protein S12 methylthiotransferase RimO [Acidobacteria bacterium]|nr:MAG: 30S ribosomal protein S12 methylthiotransferase RimO [Acidobacteriota bacterium]REK00276.1 MAG: 30S ribosomal protein S12 methylthiotransferase RimO [Acidobacteriota bacterium]
MKTTTSSSEHEASQRDRPAAPAGRVGIISLGCPKNLVDTEVMLGRLRSQGFEIVADADQADTVIVNTCGFIDEAKQESIDTILEVAARKNERRTGAAGAAPQRLFVAGCMVNRYAEELSAEIPEIDGFVGLDDLEQVGGLVSLGRNAAPRRSASHLLFDHTAPRVLTTSGYAYLKVAEGCNNPCTFCAIPVWRGRFRSRDLDSLVAEARALERSGVRELCLLAQDTTRYGEDLGYGREGLRRLVEELLARTSIPWIRFLYAYPSTLDRGLFRLMRDEQRFVSYLDIPLQHADRGMLRRMKRAGSAERYLELLAEARETVPDLFVRTTFIVGFPGEGPGEFDALVDFVQEARFDHLGAFTYSPEEDTPSAAMPDRPSAEEASARKSELLEVQRPIALERRQRLVGSEMTVLMEGVCDETEHLLVARHHGMAPEIDGRILINDGTAPRGTLARALITEAHADDLIATVVAGEAGVAQAGPARAPRELHELRLAPGPGVSSGE